MPWGGFYYTLDCLKKKERDKNIAIYCITRINPFNIYEGNIFSSKTIISQKTVSFDNISQEFALLYLWNIYFFNIALCIISKCWERPAQNRADERWFETFSLKC